MAGDREAVLLDEVEDGDPPLLLDIGVAAQDRALVEFDVDDPGIGHEGLLAGAAFSRYSRHCERSEAIPVRPMGRLDRRVATLLAMTE